MSICVKFLCCVIYNPIKNAGIFRVYKVGWIYGMHNKSENDIKDYYFIEYWFLTINLRIFNSVRNINSRLIFNLYIKL